MQILRYVFIILSALLGVAVGGLGFMLGLVLQSSYLDTDQAWGWAVMFCSVLYLTHPTLIYWLFKNAHEILAIGLSLLFMLSSITLVFFLLSAIEAGARP